MYSRPLTYLYQLPIRSIASRRRIVSFCYSHHHRLVPEVSGTKIKLIHTGSENISGNLAQDLQQPSKLAATEHDEYPDPRNGAQEQSVEELEQLAMDSAEQEGIDPATVSDREMKSLIFEQKGIEGILKALSMYERMLVEGIEPSDYIYYALVSGCSRNGLLDEAFNIFEGMPMGKVGRMTREKVITMLFTACIHENVDRKNGLRKATGLRRLLMNTRENYLNNIHYWTMIRTFTTLGDMDTAFQDVHELRSNGCSISQTTINTLLKGCIGCTETGFSYAIRMIRIMDELGLRIRLHQMNLILECVGACGTGSRQHLESLVKEWSLDVMKLKRKPLARKSDSRMIDLSGYATLDDDFDSESDLENPICPDASEMTMAIAKFLNYAARNDGDEKDSKVADIDWDRLDQPNYRLSLLGGPEWVFVTIRAEKMRYTVTTMTYLLRCLPDSIEVEEELFRRCEGLRIHFDIKFFNTLIKRRSLRAVKDRFSEQRLVDIDDVIKELQSRDLIVNGETFSALAHCCNTRKRGLKLINDMVSMRLRIGLSVIGPLIKNACAGNNVHYLKDLFTVMEEERIEPNQEMFDTIEQFIVNVDGILLEQGKGKIESSGIFNQTNYVYHYNDFKSFYKSWSQRHKKSNDGDDDLVD